MPPQKPHSDREITHTGQFTAGYSRDFTTLRLLSAGQPVTYYREDTLPDTCAHRRGIGTALLVVLAFAMGPAGYVFGKNSTQSGNLAAQSGNITPGASTTVTTNAVTQSPSRSPSPSSTEVKDPSKCVASWTVAQKLGQLIMIPVDGKGDYYLKPETPDKTRQTLREFNIGGAIVMTNINGKPENIMALTPKEGETEIPPFVATDQEGGDVTHIKDEVSKNMPSQEVVSMTMTPANATNMAKKQYENLFKKYGINTVFAPVADISRLDGKDSAITQSRIFNGDAGKVAMFVKAYLKAADELKAAHEANVFAVPKHYPGGGAMSENTDSTGSKKATIPSEQSLEKHDLQVWNLLKNKPTNDWLKSSINDTKNNDGKVKNAMMSTAIVLPDDPKDPKTSWSDGKPAIFSSDVVGSLRKTYGINGAIFSDDIGTNQIGLPLENAFVRAWEAGVTMPLFVQDVQNSDKPRTLKVTLQAIVDAGKKAVADGDITKDQLNDAVLRNLYARDLLGSACSFL